jgi:uncharacterized damage-inducible protein DinB
MELEMKSYYLRLADWANRRVLAFLQSLSTPPEKARRVFAHVLAAEQIWITRLRGEDSSALEVWPASTLEECAAWVEKNAEAYRQYLETVTDETLNSIMRYRNSQGVEFRNAVHDTLTHVVLHGSYHRGQIALIIRGAEFEPINTDFITFIRDGE